MREHRASTTPRTARAVVYTEHGGPDVLHVVDRPVGEPGPGEVRVRIHRAGVNPTDWKSRQGGGAAGPLGTEQVPGQDGAGVVDAVGPGVEAALQGVRVWVWEAAYRRPEGTTQDYALVPARQVVLLPDPAPNDLGAALGIPFLTAHRCLTVTEGGPQRLGPGTLSGRTVLVAGGAGAVGNAAIQLARWSDAQVVTTVSSPRKALLAAGAGADHVINYREEDVVREVKKIAPHGVDTVVEVAPGADAAIDAQVVGRYGAVAIYANNGGDAMTLPIRPLMEPNTRWQFVLVYTVPQGAKERAVEDVSGAVYDGAVRVGEQAGLPLHHFPLEKAADAHRAVQDGVVGKVLVDVVPGD
ncbi:MAG TPA: NADPH:quinone reductase [Kineosporiaceae bacterium]|nr:NADPH:quinone reductase [Kineosporiaceae bacterium]